jgi:hypothetical protein
MVNVLVLSRQGAQCSLSLEVKLRSSNRMSKNLITQCLLVDEVVSYDLAMIRAKRLRRP